MDFKDFKGTKGIWRVASDVTQVTTSKKGILEGSKKICHMATFCKTEEEVKANAELIAKAPELLETLIGLHKAISSGNPHELSEWNLKAKTLTYGILK